jgi:hypothetical protein
VHDGIGHRVGLEGHSFKGALILREGRGGPAESFLPGILPPGRGYGGVLAGYGFGETDFRRARGGRTRVDIDGGLGGIFGGYDLFFGNGYFVGYDSHVAIADIGGRSTGAGGTIDAQILWSGATRARAGVTFGSFSPFLAGGFALAQQQLRSFGSNALTVEMHYGATAGRRHRLRHHRKLVHPGRIRLHGVSAREPRGRSGAEPRHTDHHEVRFGIGYKL